MLNTELLIESLFLSESNKVNTFGEYFDYMIENYGDIKNLDNLPFLNESISLNQLKAKKLIKFNKNSLKVKEEFLLDKGIDINKITDKYVKPVAENLYQTIRKENFNKQGITNVTKKISNEIEQVQKNVITEVSDTLAKQLGSDSQVIKIINYTVLVSCISTINTLFIILFSLMFGEVVGYMLVSVLIAPIIEEMGKLTSAKISSDSDGGMVYNAIFNIIEFSRYYKALTSSGISKLTTILIRTPAIIMHTVNQVIIMLGVKTKEKNKDINSGSTNTLIAVCIHSIFNGFLGKIIIDAILNATKG